MIGLRPRGQRVPNTRGRDLERGRQENPVSLERRSLAHSLGRVFRVGPPFPGKLLPRPGRFLAGCDLPDGAEAAPHPGRPEEIRVAPGSSGVN